MNGSKDVIVLDRESAALKELLKRLNLDQADPDNRVAGTGLHTPAGLSAGTLQQISSNVASPSSVAASPSDLAEIFQADYKEFVSMSQLDALIDATFGAPHQAAKLPRILGVLWGAAGLAVFVVMLFAAYKVAPAIGKLGGIIVLGATLAGGYKTLLPLMFDTIWWFATPSRWIFRRRVIAKSFGFNPASPIYVRYQGEVHILPQEPKLYGYSQSSYSKRKG